MTHISNELPKPFINDVIDRAFARLGDATPPAGLERRIVRHLEVRAAVPKPASRWRIYIAATACGLLLVSIASHSLLRTKQGNTTTAFAPTSSKYTPVAPFSQLASAPVFGAMRTATQAAHSVVIKQANRVLTSDEIALAETLAPSHPAPEQPLTQQEQLFVEASRQGQPLEVAAVELAQQPSLKAAAIARDRAHMERFVHAVLAPLLLSESLNPTPLPEPITTIEPARNLSNINP